MLHMTFHTIAKSLLFLCAGNIYQRFRTDLFARIKGGVIGVMPLTGIAFFMGVLAIVGMPPFSLFQSEFLMVGAAFAGGHSVPGLLFILCATGVFAGMALHVNRLVLGPAGEARTAWYPWRDSAVLAVAVVLVVIAFWLPGPLLELIRGAGRIAGESRHGSRPGTARKIPRSGTGLQEESPVAISVGLLGPDVRPIAEYLASEYGSRLVAVFAEDRVAAENVFYNYYVFEQRGEPCYLIFQAPVDAAAPSFPSLAAQLPAVNWQEREIQDWFGLEAAGHPNPRRVALHDNWPDVHPLRKDFPLRQVLPPFEGERHVYRPTLGEGVFQIPVGPVHAGIIEPGHFNFAVAGEPILYLQLRMFYTHKGTEKLFEDMPIPHAVFLAESISGDSAFLARNRVLPGDRTGRPHRGSPARTGDAHDPARAGAAL